MGCRVSVRRLKAIMPAGDPPELVVGGPALIPGIAEADFQEQVIAEAVLNGWEYYHNPDSRRSEAGFQDLVLAHERWRKLIFAELKKDDGRERAAQKKWRRVLNACGVAAVVGRPADWPMILLELRGE